MIEISDVQISDVQISDVQIVSGSHDDTHVLGITRNGITCKTCDILIQQDRENPYMCKICGDVAKLLCAHHMTEKCEHESKTASVGHMEVINYKPQGLDFEPSIMEQKIQELENKFAWERMFGEDSIALKNTQDWLRSALQDVRNETIKECIQALPEEKKWTEWHLGHRPASEGANVHGFNTCLSESIDNLKKL